MPMRFLARLALEGLAVLLHIPAPTASSGPGETEVPAFHDVVDRDTLIAVVIVVGDPDSAEGIDGGFIFVAEVVADHFQFAAVEVAAHHQAFAEAGFPA